MATRRALDVFMPNDFPTLTYVPWDREQLEKRLRDALETPGEVVSVSGPSKSGKTVLVEKVVGRDNLITVTGAGVHKPEELWERVLDWMDVPQSQMTTTTSGLSSQTSASLSGKVAIPLVAEGAAEGKLEVGGANSKSDSSVTGRKGLSQVVREISDSDFVLLIDDFHYMERSVQTEVAKQIKEAARLHVKICTASVPHRADDVVRSNPELRGRVRMIDLTYWKPEQLKEIAGLGFPHLNLQLDGATIHKFCIESSGSPQLMQAICLQACFEIGVREMQEKLTVKALEEFQVQRILEETSTCTDFSSLVHKMHSGPKTRGTERKEFSFIDGSRGDVYRCVLLALASDPPQLGFSYNELSKRIQNVCVDDVPQPASLYQACYQIGRMAVDMFPGQRVVEWNADESMLDIIDPYFLFYIRWSGKLESLSSSSQARA